jgi:hypothetical protein
VNGNLERAQKEAFSLFYVTNPSSARKEKCCILSHIRHYTSPKIQETQTRRKTQSLAHKPTNTYYINTRQGRNTLVKELHTTTTPRKKYTETFYKHLIYNFDDLAL